MQYFKDRNQAGKELAKRLERYRDSLSVVLTYSEGGVLVGKEIAAELHLPLGMLALREISLPWKSAPIVGAVNSTGEFSENTTMDEGSRNSYEAEYHNYIDQERLKAMHEINMMHASNVISQEHLMGKTIIIVSDGTNSITQLAEVMEYLKPIKTTRLIAAMPVSDVTVIDYLHISVDEIHCLDVKDNYLDTDHYYENNEIPEYEELMNILVSFDTLS